ncbi:MAG TPA: hypothetical protein VJJ78_03440, partial [Candidatus Saccharimonadales bacterium]|nr:hypothetical protein [Candidatus Saccharimonadales bacterium]
TKQDPESTEYKITSKYIQKLKNELLDIDKLHEGFAAAGEPTHGDKLFVRDSLKTYREMLEKYPRGSNERKLVEDVIRDLMYELAYINQAKQPETEVPPTDGDTPEPPTPETRTPEELKMRKDELRLEIKRLIYGYKVDKVQKREVYIEDGEEKVKPYKESFGWVDGIRDDERWLHRYDISKIRYGIRPDADYFAKQESLEEKQARLKELAAELLELSKNEPSPPPIESREQLQQAIADSEELLASGPNATEKSWWKQPNDGVSLPRPEELQALKKRYQGFKDRLGAMDKDEELKLAIQEAIFGPQRQSLDFEIAQARSQLADLKKRVSRHGRGFASDKADKQKIEELEKKVTDLIFDRAALPKPPEPKEPKNNGKKPRAILLDDNGRPYAQI